MNNKLRYLNNFISKGDNYASGLLFNNDYDEPTYISIRVDFFPEIIDKSGYKSRSNNFKLTENGLSSNNYNMMPCPLLDNDATSDYSTLKYLNNIGEFQRSKLLAELIKGLADLSSMCPYYITSVEGVNNLLSVDPKRGSRVKSDTVLTLKCMEGLDQRISAIKNLYKKIAWDETYQRWVLPDMMRFFKMNIYISEFRIFNTTTSTIKNIDGDDFYHDLDVTSDGEGRYKSTITLTDKEIEDRHYDDIFNSRIPTTVLTCSMCEFDISNNFSHLSSISSAPKNNNLNDLEIKIKVGNLKEHTIYGLFNIDRDNDLDEPYTRFYQLGYPHTILSLNDNQLEKYNNTNSKEIIHQTEINYYLRANRLITDDHHDFVYNDLWLEQSKPDVTVLKDLKNTYLGRTIKSTAQSALGWAKSYASDFVKRLMDKNVSEKVPFSLNDIRKAIKSENIFEMINIFKHKSEDINAAYPEVNDALQQLNNENLDIRMFKNYLQDVVNTDDDPLVDTTLKQVSQYLLDVGEEQQLTSIDSYMNVLKELLNSINDDNYTSNNDVNKIKESLNEINVVESKDTPTPKNILL